MIIAFGGPDGCGKTTIARLIVKTLRKRGYPVTYTWLRYPRFFSLIPLLLSKALNLTYVYKKDDICKYRYHDFKRAPILGAVYELLLILDYTLYKFFKVTIPKFVGYVVVIDRYLLDVAVDILVERGSLTRFTAYYLSREIKQPKFKEIVLADENLLLQRRRDNLCNPNLRKTIYLYKLLCGIYGVNISQNNRPEDLLRIVSRIARSFRPVRVYVDPKSQFIRALFL